MPPISDLAVDVVPEAHDLPVRELLLYLAQVQEQRVEQMRARLPATRLALLEHDLTLELGRRNIEPPRRDSSLAD